MIPATDGGFVLLAIPPDMPSLVFQHNDWSTNTTGDTQIATIKKHGFGMLFFLSMYACMQI